MKRSVLILVAVLAIMVGVVEFSSGKVGADANTETVTTQGSLQGATYQWENAASIQATLGDGQTINFFDGNGTADYLGKKQGPDFFGGDCTLGGGQNNISGQSTLSALSWDPSAGGSVQWKYSTAQSGICDEYPNGGGFNHVTIGNSGSSDIIFHWNDSNNDIEDVSNGNTAFQRKSATAPNVYTLKGAADCGSASNGTAEIVIDSNDNATFWPLISNGGSQKVTDSSTYAVGCYIDSNTDDGDPLGTEFLNGAVIKANGNGSYNVHVYGVPYISTNSKGQLQCTENGVTQPCPASTVSSVNSGTTGSQGGVSNTCPSSDLSWLICPIADAIDSMILTFNNEIQSLLQININQYFSDSCANATANQTVQVTSSTNPCSTTDVNYQIWGNIRDIALSLLVVVGLIMVISTAIDVGPFDAYTVKKIMPRILIAVIGVSFSWEIGRFLVQFSDDLGAGVENLITSVLPTSVNIASVTGDALGWFGAAGVAGVLFLAAVGPVALLMLLLPALIAFAIGFLILIARQLIVVICVLTAPIAFISFVLPGTNGVWKFWQKNFFGALFVYPMITGAIGIGVVMAYLIQNGQTTNYAGIDPILALVFILAPYFLIPRIFRMSNGMLGTIANGVNSASQGLFKAAKQAQRNKMASSWEKAKKGDLYHGYSWLPGSQKLASRTGKISKGVGAGWRGHYGMGERGKAMIHRNDNAAADEYARTPENAAIKDYDDAQRAMTYANASEADKGLEQDWGIKNAEDRRRAIEAVRSSGGFGGFYAIAAAKNLAQSTTAYKDVDIKRADGTTEHRTAMEQAVETINRVSHGNEGISAGLSAFTSAAAKQQRPDISPGAEAFIGLSRDRMKFGKLDQKVYDDHLDKAFKGAGSIQGMLAYAKKPAVESFVRRQLQVLQSAPTTEQWASMKPEEQQAFKKRRGEAAINLSEMAGNFSSAGGDQRDAILEGLQAGGIDIRGEGTNISTQLINMARGGATGEYAATINGETINGTNLGVATRTWGSEGQAEAGQRQNTGEPPEAAGGEPPAGDGPG